LFLLFEEEPDHDFGKASYWWYPRRAIEQLNELIERAFRAGEITGFENIKTEYHPEDFDYEMKTLIQICTRKGNLGTWLKKMGFVAPEELKDAIGENEIASGDATGNLKLP
jgi:hypothetical protein